MRLLRRCRRRAAPERAARRDAGDSILMPVLTIIMGTLLTAATGFWALAELERFGPSVGAVVVLRPGTETGGWWQISAEAVNRSPIERLDDGAGRKCVLSPADMAGKGGSMVVEARRQSRPPVYRVHWAGGHTSPGTNDCGTSADLLLSRSELMRLANVAGGFSDGLRLVEP